MHLGEEIFSCIFQLSTSLLTLSKHRGEDIHNKSKLLTAEHVKPSSTQFRKTKLNRQEALVDRVCPSTKTTRPINSNM